MSDKTNLNKQTTSASDKKMLFISLGYLVTQVRCPRVTDAHAGIGYRCIHGESTDPHEAWGIWSLREPKADAGAMGRLAPTNNASVGSQPMPTILADGLSMLAKAWIFLGFGLLTFLWIGNAGTS
jgi:hypothetical protein